MEMMVCQEFLTKKNQFGQETLTKTLLPRKQPNIMWGTAISKNAALLLVLFFLTSSLLIVDKPVSAASTVENSWVELAPMHQARADLGVAVVDGKIYAIGGKVLVYQDALRTESKDVGTNEEYDPAFGNWTDKAPMPISSSDFATAAYNGKIYCIGGGVNELFNSSTLTWDVRITKGFNEVYDPVTDKWKNKTPAPLPQVSAQADVVNGKIYLVDGYPNGTLVQVYDPSIDKWVNQTQLPIPGALASGVLDNKIYFFGNSMTQIYDPNTGAWSEGSPPLSTFFKGTLGITTGIMAPKRIYVFYNPLNALNSSSYSIQVYDPENNSWLLGANLPSQRQDFGVAVVNDVVYVIGGYSLYGSWTPYAETWQTTYFNSVEAYAPFGYGTVPPAISIDSPRSINYSSNELALNFTTNKPVTWAAYSLDGQRNITISGNSTLTGLSSGKHNITVYANDAYGNMGASETVAFNISPPFPIVPVAAASVAVIVATAASLLVYFKKRKH
jgi:hypothetical protein